MLFTGIGSICLNLLAVFPKEPSPAVEPEVGPFICLLVPMNSACSWASYAFVTQASSNALDSQGFACYDNVFASSFFPSDVRVGTQRHQLLAQIRDQSPAGYKFLVDGQQIARQACNFPHVRCPIGDSLTCSDGIVASRPDRQIEACPGCA